MTAPRARAAGQQLVEVHRWLRRELARLRASLDRFADGDDTVSVAPLLAHCTAFCAALTRHHTGEDTTVFPALAERFPELAPVLRQMQRDHSMVTYILHRLEALLATLTPDTVESVQRELDGLAAILESHFQWEERRLTDALDALDLPGGVQ